jgi:putative FmdB family regulatory protein
MPIYEYKCENGHNFEVMQRMSDDPVTACQVCEAPVERVFHPIAIHFKGSGFYSTDYGSRKRSREMKDAGEGKGKGKDGDSSGSSSDSSSSTTETTSSSSSSSSSGSSKSDGKGSSSSSD